MTIRVLHVYKDYWPVVGGIENLVRRLAIGLQADPEFAPRVLVTNPGWQTVREEIDGVPVVKAGRLATVASTPLSLALVRELARQPAEIVHLHAPYPLAELAYLLTRHPGRLVLTYHSDIVRQRRLLPLYRPFLWQLLRRAEVITVSSPHYAAGSPILRALGEKLRLVPFGVDPARFALTPERAARVARLKAELSGPLVLFVGVLRYYKGLEVLIPVMGEVPATLVILGEGREGARLRALAAAQPHADRIVFRGRVEHDELVAFYHAADVFVLPSTSRAEAFGVVLLEAMACGLPVVTTELGTGTSFVNLHQQTGLVVPPGDRAALAAALRSLLADPTTRQRYGAAARRRVEQEFSEAQMLAATKTLYREVLARPARC
ncbi:MAG: glycosyl transferase family 1 [Dehalococcoidia bacterium]|nr:MAG: glycosyl transferase family 1 [Dehalococcoidia bacterium]